VGASRCDYCEPGTYIHEAEDSTKTCEECVAGKYSQTGANSAEGCLTCDTGKYSERGSAYCSRCGLGEGFVEELNSCETCDVGFASLGDTACLRCEGVRDYADEPEQAVCKQSAPGEMPNTDNTGVVDCPEDTDLEGCVCPKNTFLTLERDSCKAFADKGVDLSSEGMTLATLRVLPGYWRTDNRSSDVRPCPVAEACVGWNASALFELGTYCREGHVGPYCNLCKDGYAGREEQLCALNLHSFSCARFTCTGTRRTLSSCARSARPGLATLHTRLSFWS
jgi:hypothetical protein